MVQGNFCGNRPRPHDTCFSEDPISFSSKLGLDGAPMSFLFHKREKPQDTATCALLARPQVDKACGLLEKSLDALEPLKLGFPHEIMIAEAHIGDVLRVLKGFPSTGNRRGSVLANRELLAEARSWIRVEAGSLQSLWRGDARLALIGEDLKAAYAATCPALPAKAEEILELLKNPKIGTIQFQHEESAAFRSHRTYGAYGISCLGDIVVSHDGDLLASLPEPLDAVELEEDGYVTESTWLEPEALNQVDLELLRSFAADFGFTAETRVPEPVCDLFMANQLNDALRNAVRERKEQKS